MAFQPDDATESAPILAGQRLLLTEAIEHFSLAEPLILVPRTTKDLSVMMIDAWCTQPRFGTALVTSSDSGRHPITDSLSVARFFRIQRGEIILGIDVGSIGLELADLHVRHPSGGIRVLRAQIFTQQVDAEGSLACADALCEYFETRAKLVGVHRLEFLTFDPRVARVLADRGYDVSGASLPGTTVRVVPTHERLAELRRSNSVLPFADHWQAARSFATN